MNTLNKNDIPKKAIIFPLYLCGMYVIGFILYPVIWGLLVFAFPNNPHNQEFAATLLNFLIYATLFLLFLFFLRDFYKEQFIRFKNKFWIIVGYAFAAWAAIYMLNILVEMIMQIFHFTPRESANQEAVVQSFQYPLLSIPVVLFGAPLVEETVFRGVIFNFFRNLKLPLKLNLILAFFMSSCLFGLIHVFMSFLQSGDWTELILGITYAVTGLVLTFVYYFTNNLFASMLTHFIQNAFATIMIFLLPLLLPSTPVKVGYVLGKLTHLI